MKKIGVGSKIPSFSLLDQNGDRFVVNGLIGKKKLVLYFYPKDESPVCTKQACAFRDQFAVFEQANATVIGISGQTVESHKAFADKYHLNFTLLADTGNVVRELFGVRPNLFGLLPGRVTFVVDLTGTVVYQFTSQLSSTRHVEEALRILKALP